MKKAVVLIFCVQLSGALFSQRAITDKEKITIGDRCILSLVIPKSMGTDIQFPVFENTLIPGIEIIDMSDIITSSDDKTLQRDYTITSFEDSLFMIPPFKFSVDGKEILTNPVKLQVLDYRPDSAFLSKIDTTQQIPLADIKAPVHTPLTFKEFFQRFWIYFAITAFLAFLYIVYRYFKKKQKNRAPAETLIAEIPIPAHVIAIKQLDALKLTEIHKEKDVDPFYIALSKIIRQYMESRFHIPALESATYEILGQFKKTEFAESAINSKLQDLLSLSDMVKFAKDQPDLYRNEIMFEYAYSFIQHTKEQEISKTEEQVTKDLL
jgi:hypothetical protein